MITCAARTGSTMLVRTLRSHPGLIVHGEVWGDTMVGLDGPLADACREAPLQLQALERLRFSDPASALQKFHEPHNASAAGFKLKFDELVRPQWAEVRKLVEDDAGIAIVFLHRRDLLQRYLSHQVVLQQTGVTVVAAGDTPPAVEPFTVDIDDLLRDIDETRRRTQLFESAFSAHPWMRVEYEALAANPQGECARVFDFLGVAPAAVSVPTRKIVQMRPEQLVRNFDAVQAALRAHGAG